MTEPSSRTVVVEVTNTLSVDFTTGIQRVVREVLRGLRGPHGAGLEVIPVLQPSPDSPFRRLTDAEALRLDTHPAGGRAGRRADDLGPLSPLARRVGDLPLTIRLRSAFSAWRRRRRELHPTHRELAFDEFGPGVVFLDLEGSWYDPTPRGELLPDLLSRGVTCVPFVYDVMPVRFPQWFPPQQVDVFGDWVRAHALHADAAFAISRRTAEDLAEVVETEQPGRTIPTTVVPLGAELPSSHPRRPAEAPDDSQRFLLVVGTLEPRKDQALVLDAFDRLNSEFGDLALVLVGKEGWMVDSFVRRIRSHPMFGDRLRWLGGVDDDELAWLYQHAFVVVAPSRYEGYGMPVIEGLANGAATIASSGGAQIEAAGAHAETFAPGDLDELCSLLRRHLTDADHHQHQRKAAAGYQSTSWDDTARVVGDTLRNLA